MSYYDEPAELSGHTTCPECDEEFECEDASVILFLPHQYGYWAAVRATCPACHESVVCPVSYEADYETMGSDR